MRISDWSSDVCSSDLRRHEHRCPRRRRRQHPEHAMSDTPNNGRKLSLKRGTESTAGTPRLEERLHKVLAQAGLGSRRALEQRIADGLVQVNGEVAQTGMSIGGGDRVEIDGKVFVASALTDPSRVLIYNKPEGEVTTREDPEGRPTIFESLPALQGARWLAVGRLALKQSDERRVGKECVKTGRSRWSP